MLEGLARSRAAKGVPATEVHFWGRKMVYFRGAYVIYRVVNVLYFGSVSVVMESSNCYMSLVVKVFCFGAIDTMYRVIDLTLYTVHKAVIKASNMDPRPHDAQH